MTPHGLRRLVVLAACLALAPALPGCGGDERADSAMEGTTAKKDAMKPGSPKPPAKPQPSAVVSTQVPESFPDDVPLYPGARTTTSKVAPDRSMLVSFASDDAPNAVYRFYRDALTATGFHVEADLVAEGSRMFSLSKGARQITITISRAGRGSEITIMAGG